MEIDSRSKDCVTYRVRFVRSAGGWEIKCGDDASVLTIGRGRRIAAAIHDYEHGLSLFDRTAGTRVFESGH